MYVLGKSFLRPVLAMEQPPIHETQWRNLRGNFKNVSVQHPLQSPPLSTQPWWTQPLQIQPMQTSPLRTLLIQASLSQIQHLWIQLLQIQAQWFQPLKGGYVGMVGSKCCVLAPYTSQIQFERFVLVLFSCDKNNLVFNFRCNINLMVSCERLWVWQDLMCCLESVLVSWVQNKITFDAYYLNNIESTCRSNRRWW